MNNNQRASATHLTRRGNYIEVRHAGAITFAITRTFHRYYGNDYLFLVFGRPAPTFFVANPGQGDAQALQWHTDNTGIYDQLRGAGQAIVETEQPAGHGTGLDWLNEFIGAGTADPDHGIYSCIISPPEEEAGD